MKYPFKFLDAYERADKDFFFGREKEVEQLYEMTFQTNTVFLYGPSGAGKTSLLQCGLANRFQTTDWFELFVRKGESINESLRLSLEKALNQVAVDEDLGWEDDFVDDLTEETIEVISTTPEQTLLSDLYHTTFKPIYIIFDQFEELYTLGTKEEQSAFISTIKMLMKVEIPCTFLFSMREEYLFHLYEFEIEVPHLLQKKLRVESMNEALIKEVLIGSTTHEDSSISFRGSSDERNIIIENIFKKISEGKRLVQLSYLQIFMDAMYQEVTGIATDRTKEVVFTASDVAKMPKIDLLLQRFLDRQINTIGANIQQLNQSKKYRNLPQNIVSQVLSSMVTFEETKKPISLSELKNEKKFTPWKSTDLISRVLQELISSRIIRYRKEDDIYEITHDALAKQIAENRSLEEKSYLKAQKIVVDAYGLYKDEDTKRLLDSKELNFIQPFIHRLKEELDSEKLEFVLLSKRKRRNFLLGIAWAFILLLLAAIYIIYFVNSERKEAITAKAVAIEHQKVAESAQQSAELEREKAKVAEQKARNTADSIQELLVTITEKDQKLREGEYLNLITKGRALMGERQFQDAIIVFKKALVFQPNDKHARNQIEESKRLYNGFIELDKLFKLAEKEEEDEKYTLAKERYKKALELNIDNEKVRQAIKSIEKKGYPYYEKRAKDYEELKDVDKEIKAWKKALEMKYNENAVKRLNELINNKKND